MLEQTRGIVLNHIKYSDSAAIAHIYTEHFGRLSIMVRHSNNKKSVSKKSILQPLFLMVLDVQYKQSREIQQAKEISNYPVFHEIPFNFTKSSIAFFIAEILSKVLKEEEANTALFEFLFHSIQLLDNCQEGVANFHLVFLLELSKYLGFYPENNHSPDNKYFNIREGYFSSIIEMPDMFLDKELSESINQLSIAGFKKMTELKFSGSRRVEILHSLIRYYQYHLVEMGQIKSLSILKQIFEP